LDADVLAALRATGDGWQTRINETLRASLHLAEKTGIGLGKRAAQTFEEAEMKKQNMGSDFDDFLAEEGMLEEVTAVAVKRVIAWQIEQEMLAQKMTKTAMAKKMRTSRASLNRLLDENDTSLTLTTLAGAAAALGRRIRLELTPA
jgi:DNA-binding Xre family transcriptional regulator